MRSNRGAWYGAGGDIENVSAVCAVRAVPESVECGGGCGAGEERGEWGTDADDAWWQRLR